MGSTEHVRTIKKGKFSALVIALKQEESKSSFSKSRRQIKEPKGCVFKIATLSSEDIGGKRGKDWFLHFCVGTAAAAETLATADTGGTLPDRQVEKIRIYNSPDFQWISYNLHSFQDLEVYKGCTHSLSGVWGYLQTYQTYLSEVTSYLQTKKSTPQNLIDVNHTWVWVKTINAAELCQRGKFFNHFFFFPPTGNSRCSIVFVVVAAGRFTMVFSMPEDTGKD